MNTDFMYADDDIQLTYGMLRTVMKVRVLCLPEVLDVECFLGDMSVTLFNNDWRVVVADVYDTPWCSSSHTTTGITPIVVSLNALHL